jgi:hypothetical protein
LAGAWPLPSRGHGSAGAVGGERLVYACIAGQLHGFQPSRKTKLLALRALNNQLLKFLHITAKVLDICLYFKS